jgi:integrase
MASVYCKNDRWYLRVKDATGKWRDLPSKAVTKAEAKIAANDYEAKARRQAQGLEPLPLPRRMTVADLCDWWLENRCPSNSKSRETSRLKKHVTSQPVGQVLVERATPSVFEDRFRAMEREGLAPATINGLRRVLHGVFARGAKDGLAPLQNPLAAVDPRRVPKRTYVTLAAEEVPTLLAAATPEWRGIFATAIYAGLRKGELFGLRKSDVDLRNGTITVARSYDKETTKGGHADVLPIAEPLVPFLKAAIETSPSELVFPNPTGGMRSGQSGVERVLRRVLGGAGLVDGYVHTCRRCKAAGKSHTERHRDAERRICPKCGAKLWVKPLPRHMRFHDLRHTTATLLLRAGVDLVRVQRILRHSDVRLTADTYGHLVVEDLRDAVNTIAAANPNRSARGRGNGTERG